MAAGLTKGVREARPAFHGNRRLAGVLLGAVFGFALGFVSQFVNRIYLPQVPFYQPPLGAIGNSLACTAIGALIGAVAAWPAGAVTGVVLSSAAAAATIVLLSLLGVRLSFNLPGYTTIALFLWLPLTGMIAPLTAILRWQASRQAEALYDREPLGRRVKGPLLISLLVALLGLTSMLRWDGRAVMGEADQLIRAGQAASTSEVLPVPLRSEDVDDFLAHGTGGYTLEYVTSNLNDWRIPRPTENFDYHAIVVARFDNGWMMACLYPEPGRQPECRSY